MSINRALLAVLAGTVGPCLYWGAGEAGPVTLNIRPGLWEITSSGENAGTLPVPPEVLARLTPEQRARFQAAMAGSMARAGTPHVYKSCITVKRLQRGFDTGDNGAQHKCTQTVLSSSSSTMDGRMECAGERGRMSGQFHFEAPNSTTVSGTIDMTAGNAAHKMTVKRVIRGKWVSADCGQYTHEGD